MNTTKETKEYIEPAGFNGTKGEWKMHKHAAGHICNLEERGVANTMGYTSNMDNGEHIEENKANAILLSQSKEMAKTIEDLITIMDRARNILNKYDGGNWGMLDTKKAKEVLNKALNKTI